MKIVDGRGKKSTERKKANMESIRKFFEENPDKTKADCARATCLSYQTVIRLTKEL